MTAPFLTFFPQFCKEPLNDGAWYPGFTDWDLIKDLPAGVRERFTPAAGYYDLAVPEVISRQFASVAQSAWPSMALYHYFFDGRFVLDSVERFIIGGGTPVPPFFVIWANETWSKRWIGKPGEIIIRQNHSLDPEAIRAHVGRLASLFRHSSYVRRGDRPFFVIYAPYEIPRVGAFVGAYREEFARVGVNPLMGFCVPYIDPRFDAREFDFCVEFQPRLFFNTVRARQQGRLTSTALFVKHWAPWCFEQITGVRDRLKRSRSEPGFLFSYQDYLELLEADYFTKALESAYQKPVYRSLFFSWNNFPRYRGSGVAVSHSEGDYAAFMDACRRVKTSQEWFLVNSWNEWSEGAALEPGIRPPTAFEAVAAPIRAALAD